MVLRVLTRRLPGRSSSALWVTLSVNDLKHAKREARASLCPHHEKWVRQCPPTPTIANSGGSRRFVRVCVYAPSAPSPRLLRRRTFVSPSAPSSFDETLEHCFLPAAFFCFGNRRRRFRSDQSPFPPVISLASTHT